MLKFGAFKILLVPNEKKNRHYDHILKNVKETENDLSECNDWYFIRQKKYDEIIASFLDNTKNW